ncbi:MAG: DUF2878 domain-containing protein [Filomicrobium sp.]
MDTRPDGNDVLINTAAFVAAWLALLHYASQGQEEFGLAAGIAVVIFHIWRSPMGLAEAKLIALVTAVGTGAEALIMYLGLASYSGVSLNASLPPWWVMAQWAVFATLLNVALRPIRSWILLSLGLGFVFLPIAKLLVMKFGVVDLTLPVHRSIALIGLCWSVVLTAVFALARIFDGWEEQ